MNNLKYTQPKLIYGYSTDLMTLSYQFLGQQIS
jgi:hypothetical protein